MSAYIQGTPRGEQSFLPRCHDDYIDAGNPVRALDAFVDTLEFGGLGFVMRERGSVGRPGFHPATLMRIYLWGYLRGTRSSRGLERACRVNLELIWLTGDLHPDHSVISAFRKDNAALLPGIFSQFTALCVEMGLFGRELMTIDGTFVKAVNSKARSFTRAKLKKLIAKAEAAAARYLELLDTTDAQEEEQGGTSGGGGRAALEAKLEKIRGRQTRLQGLLEDCGESPTGQVNLTDPDSVQLRKNGRSTTGYNVQAAVDAEHHLVAAVEVTQDGNDKQQLDAMAQKAKAETGLAEKAKLEVLADAGYPTSTELAACAGHNTTVTAPVPNISANPGVYSGANFERAPGGGGYICPAGHLLERKGDKLQDGTLYETYSNRKACRGCELRALCTKSSYRLLKINAHREHVQAARERLAANPAAMARRASIAEHPFGTIKAGGGGELLCRGKQLASAEVNLGFWSYNFKRALEVLGVQGLMRRMREISAARGALQAA